MYRIETTPGFDKDLKSLDRSASAQIIEKFEWLSRNPEALKHPLKHLPDDLKNLHKYRVGGYRILLWVDHNSKIITLYAVNHRKDIYRDL